MPGAIGAVMAVRRNQAARAGRGPTPRSRAEEKRLKAAEKEYEHRVKLNKVIKCYDTDKTNRLERDQLIKLLTDLDSSTPQGAEPSCEEVEFVLKCADKGGDGAVDAGELEDVLVCWKTYIDHRDEMEATMQKYDVDKTGQLSKNEVKQYLIDLNGGQEISEEEVDRVMQAADVVGDGHINMMELSRATAFWYGFVEEKEEKTKSSCCDVM